MENEMIFISPYTNLYDEEKLANMARLKEDYKKSPKEFIENRLIELLIQILVGENFNFSDYISVIDRLLLNDFL